MDDDFKISMDDIKDMVSELFGEKVQKVEADKAKKILSEDLELFNIEEASKLSEEEENLLNDFEQGKLAPEPAVEPQVDFDELKKKIEEETRAKLEAEMREKVKQEMAEEQQRKKEEVLKKIEAVKQESATVAPEPAAPAAEKQEAGGITTNYSEKISLIQMFEQSQKLYANLLAKLIKRRPVETMFIKTLEKAMDKYPKILRKIDINQYGKARVDGSIEMGRLAANVNAINLPEGEKTKKFLAALSEVFEERLIATELATGIETKDEVMSSLIMQLEKLFVKRNYSKRVNDIFMEYVIPSTTMKPGEL